jgi:hypothetical protein
MLGMGSIDSTKKISMVALIMLTSLVLAAISVIYIWVMEGFNPYNPKVILILIIYFILQIPLYRIQSKAYEEWISD